MALGSERHRAGGGGVGSGRVRRPCGGDDGRRQERRRGGEHGLEGGEWVLTAWSVEAGEHRSGPATEAKGGAGELAVVAAWGGGEARPMVGEASWWRRGAPGALNRVEGHRGGDGGGEARLGR